jgi:hypothetical protein
MRGHNITDRFSNGNRGDYFWVDKILNVQELLFLSCAKAEFTRALLAVSAKSRAYWQTINVGGHRW